MSGSRFSRGAVGSKPLDIGALCGPFPIRAEAKIVLPLQLVNAAVAKKWLRAWFPECFMVNFFVSFIASAVYLGCDDYVRSRKRLCIFYVVCLFLVVCSAANFGTGFSKLFCDHKMCFLPKGL
jgi:hypothetical protein